MAKKKARSKLIIPIVIAGIFIALFLTTGFPFQFIQVEANLQDAQELLDDILNLPDEFQIPVYDCTDISETGCEGDVGTEPTVTIPIDDDDGFPIPNTNVTIIDPIDEVIIENMTVIVDDDGTVVDPEPMPEPFDVSISSKIFKTDNNGTLTESTTNFAIPLLAFFVEDTSNIDFDNGFLEQELILNAEPNTSITLNADFDVLIANQTILNEKLTISITGMTDENGELKIDYVNTLGLKSDNFFFSFADHVDKFQATGIDKVEFVINNVRVSSGEFEYALESGVIYSIEIARDPNQIIITDESGGKARIFPTDSVISVGSYANSYTYVKTSRVYPYRTTITACCIPAPAMGGGEFTHILQDGTEEVLATFPSNTAGSCVTAPFTHKTTCTQHRKITNLLIQRDEIYRLDVTSPTKASITFKTPIERETYSFYCKTSQSSGVQSLSCNFLSPTLQQQLADTLVSP